MFWTFGLHCQGIYCVRELHGPGLATRRKESRSLASRGTLGAPWDAFRWVPHIICGGVHLVRIQVFKFLCSLPGDHYSWLDTLRSDTS